MAKLKASIPYLLILLLVGWFSYKFFVERKIPKEAQEQKMTLDWDQLDSTSSSKPAVVPPSIKKMREARPKVAGGPDEYSSMTKSEEAQFAVFDQIEKKWLEEVKGILGETHYGRYVEMREQNEKAKMQAYKEYHDFLRKKYGDKFSYNISEDQSISEKKINQAYLKQLLELIGQEKFKAYLKARDRVNEENRRRHQEFIQVEF